MPGIVLFCHRASEPVDTKCRPPAAPPAGVPAWKPAGRWGRVHRLSCRDCSVLRKVGTPILKALENITLKECTPSLFYWME